MTRRAYHGGLASKSRPAKSWDKAGAEGDARAAWGLLIGRAREAAGKAAAGGRYDRPSAAAFDGLVLRIKGTPFPLRHVSAGNAAEAFLVLARGFVAAQHPASMAGFLRAGADCLAELLEDDRRSRFVRSCAVVGSD